MKKYHIFFRHHHHHHNHYHPHHRHQHQHRHCHHHHHHHHHHRRHHHHQHHHHHHHHRRRQLTMLTLDLMIQMMTWMKKRIIRRNISPSVNISCSSGLNGSDPEQMNDKGWRPSLDIVDTWNACFDSKLVYLQ